MVYKLIRTQTALSELDSIVTYLSKKLGNPFAAETLLDEIEDTILTLETMPKLYVPVSTPRFAQIGCRKAFIKNYVMVYKVDEDAKTVHILHFFHASQDYESYL